MIRFLRDKLSKAKQEASNLNLTEFDQTRFDAALAWVLKSRAGVVILNVASIEILTTVSLLKKAKTMLNRFKGNAKKQHIESVVNGEQAPLTRLFEQQEKPRVLIIAEASIPQCLHYRVQQKVEQLESLGCFVEWHDWSDLDALRQKTYLVDIVLFYRVPGYPRILELMRHAKALQKLVIYDIDDLIFDRQQLQKKFQQTSNQLNDKDIQGILNGADLYKTAIEHSSYGIASTPALQVEMSRLLGQGHCYFLPNGLDKSISDLAELPTVKGDDDQVIIFYGSGTKTHDEDFASISLPLSQVMAENDHVYLVLIGHLGLPVELEVFRDRIQRLPLIDFESFLHCLKHADIAIAPLEAGKFADCKSEIKWLEAACFAVPSVVTKTTRYDEVIDQGKTGLMADDEAQWYSALSDLVSQPDLRKKIGQKAKLVAEKNYGCDAMAAHMKTLLQTLQNQAVEDGLLAKTTGKKRLLLVNVLYPPQAIGGATTVVAQSVRGIAERYSTEFDVSILTTEMSDSEPYTLREYDEGDVHVTVIKTPFHSQLETRESDSNIFSLCQSWYRKNRPDLIHFHSVQRLTGSAVEAARLLDIPYLITVHDAWWLSEHQFLLDANNERINSLQANPFQLGKTAKNVGAAIQRAHYLAEQLRGSKGIIAVSEYQASLYQRNGFDNVEIVRNGVSVSFSGEISERVAAVDKSPSNKLVIGYLGGITAHKGYHFLKEIVESGQFDQLSFKVVDLFKPYGFSRSSDWGRSHVETIGKFSVDNIAEFYQSIDVLIAPSIWPESFGLVAREAALQGVWVIAADAGGMAEDVIEGKTGFVFPMGDQQACSQILEMLQDNVDYYKNTKPEISLSEKKIVSVEQHVEQLVQLYR